MSHRFWLLGLVLALTLLCSRTPNAGAATVDDFLSGCKDTTGGPGTVTLLVVPPGMRFVLTDFEISFQSITPGTSTLFSIGTGGTTRWRTTVYETTGGILIPNLHWSTGIVFQAGEAVQVTNTSAGVRKVCWSGYLVPSSATGVIPVDPERSIQLGIVPNPSSTSSQIHFQLAERSHTTLGIYDVQGRRVRLLYSGPLDGGDHTLGWDGRGDAGHLVPDGVYFCRLETGDRASARKLSRVR